jgi:hypothetical protein
MKEIFDDLYTHLGDISEYRDIDEYRDFDEYRNDDANENKHTDISEFNTLNEYNNEYYYNIMENRYLKKNTKPELNILEQKNIIRKYKMQNHMRWIDKMEQEKYLNTHDAGICIKLSLNFLYTWNKQKFNNIILTATDNGIFGVDVIKKDDFTQREINNIKRQLYNNM